MFRAIFIIKFAINMRFLLNNKSNFSYRQRMKSKVMYE